MRLDNIKLMMTKEECEKRARELLKTPKEDVLTNYMFMEQEIDRLNKLLDETRLSELHKEYIINEFEKDINNELMMTRKFDKYNEGYFDATLHYYNILKELKENNKDV